MRITKEQKLKTIQRIEEKNQLILQEFDVNEFEDNFKLHKFLWWIKEKYGLTYREKVFETQSTSKNRCDQDQNWFLWKCTREKCSHKHKTKMICSSFFCPDCHEHYTKKLRINMMDYIVDCNHRLAVFTTPSEAWPKINWNNINILYDVVRETIQEYFEKNKERYYGQKPKVGIIAILHTYGSVDMGWKPHINIFISTLGFVKCSKKYHAYNQLNNAGSFEDCIHEYHPVSTAYIDYKKIRKIYKQKLSEAFNLEKNFSPQIKFDENVPEDDDMYDIAEECVQAKKAHKKIIGIPIKELIKKMVDYFRRIPLNNDDITVISNKYIGFTTYKRQRLKLSWMFLPHNIFYYFVTQHIPKQNFRNLRLWDAYHYQSKIKKFRSQKTLPPLECNCLNLIKSINPDSSCKKCHYYTNCKKRYKCPDCHAAIVPRENGFICSQCERLIPFSYYTVAFNNGINSKSENPLCPECGADMEMILGVIGGKVAYLLSNTMLDSERDFSQLKIGSEVSLYQFSNLSKGGLPYG